MTKVSPNRECDERERLIPCSSKEEDSLEEEEEELEEEEEECQNLKSTKAKLTRPESSQDIPIDSSPLIDRRRPSRWQDTDVERMIMVNLSRGIIDDDTPITHKVTEKQKPPSIIVERSRERSEQALAGSRGDA